MQQACKASQFVSWLFILVVYLYTDMHTFLISLGSNENREENMRLGNHFLKEIYPEIKFSDVIETEPFGEIYKSKFYNQLAAFDTNQSKPEVIDILKKIEKLLGRLESDKTNGIVKIDIDLIAIGTEIISDDVFTRPYMKKLLQNFDVGFSYYLDYMGYFQ